MRGDFDTDVVVVGSGAAGSVIAYHLARRGERVVLLERGQRVEPERITQNELEMFALLYKDGGAQMNTSADMFLLQGNCVGGSTVLTNAVCFRMPEDVRRRFANRGFELPVDHLEDAYVRVESVLNVATLDRSLWNPAAHRLAEGMRTLGLEPGEFPKCMLRCIGCGTCNLGCPYGRKLDASRTWVPMAERHGAVVLPESEARRILVRGGAARGVLCRDLRDGRSFRVRAKRTVLAGGAINSPELLLRSGILPGRVGRRACFNIGTIMHAEYEEPVDAYDGDQMCVHHFTDRYAIEQIHNPPGSYALTLPAPFRQHHDLLERYRHLTSAGVLVPTTPVGRVFLGWGRRLVPPLFDHAEVSFRMPPGDAQAMRDGFKQLAHIFLASGARRVIPPARRFTEIRSASEVDRAIEAALPDHAAFSGLGSAHPQGGCALGDDARRDVVDPSFRVHGFEDLFVCDASVFPFSVRVNPMLSIMAVADVAVRHIGGFTPEGPIQEGPAWEARRRQARPKERAWA